MFYLRSAPVADFSLGLSAPGLVLSHGVKWVEPGCSLWEMTPACSLGLSAQDSVPTDGIKILASFHFYVVFVP